MKKFINSRWLFPIILILIVSILSLLRISGSSVGQYNSFFYGDNYQDPDLIYNKSQSIRSDEWLVTAPLLVAQYQESYPLINANIGNGADMSVAIDVPYKDWSTLFKPQNLGFIFLPIEVAFALRWWLPALLLVISCYLFITELTPKNRLFAVFLSLGLPFIPFIQWWYSAGTIFPLAFLFIILTLLIELTKKHNDLKKNLLLSLGLIYSFVTFALIMYPPFQIPCMLIGVVFYTGYIIEGELPKKDLLRIAKYLIPSIIIALAFIGLFFITRLDTIKTTINTVYPGMRVVRSGGEKVSRVFSGVYNYNLDCCGKYSPSNQSESSNFVFLIPTFIVALIAMLASKKRWQYMIFYLLFGLTGLFFAHLFLPLPLWFEKIFLLDKVPLSRIVYGVGIINIIFIITLAYYFENKKFSIKPRWLILVGCIFELAINLYVFRALNKYYPLLLGVNKFSYAIVLLVNITVILAVYLLLTKRLAWFSVLFFVSMFLSSYTVNPLYRGLGPLLRNPLVEEIQAIDRDSPGVWGTVDNIYLLNYPVAAGVKSLTATYVYPQLELWRQLDTNNKFEGVYNRYAKISLSTNPQVNEEIPIKVLDESADSILLALLPCSDFEKRYLKYVISLNEINIECMKEIKNIKYGEKTVWFYELYNN
jgi:hypothetical protein